MKLEDLGCNAALDKQRIENNLENIDIGRVKAEQKEKYIVKTETAELQA